MIIDAHSHIGKDFKHAEPILDEYIEYLKELGISIGLVMPVPAPSYTINTNSGSFTMRMVGYSYDEEKDEFSHHSIFKDGNGNEYTKPVIQNPYRHFNYKCFKEITSKTDDAVRLEFVPMLHPIFDTLPYLEKLVRDMKPIAFKIHGIGSGVGPNDFSDDMIHFLQRSRIPLILHTDFDNTMSGDAKGVIALRNRNRPLDWARFLVANNLKGVLNHGAALDTQAIDIANNSNNVFVGLGPDIDIDAFPDRLMVDRTTLQEKGYLRILKGLVKPERLLFDVDFNWNMVDRNTGEIDHDCIKRVEDMWEDPEDRKKIFSENALSFFNIRERDSRASEVKEPHIL